MREGDVRTGVGKTALGVAMVRAEESRRQDRLFDDPYAHAFLAAAPGAFDAEQRAAPAGGGDLESWGTAFWSHAVKLAAAADGLRQVVLLAAGLDTRAYRLPWPDGIRLYELDLPEVLEFKQRVLDGQAAVPHCERTTVPTDLRADCATPLKRVGLATSEPTAWLAEGLLVYLAADEAEQMLTSVGELSAACSRLAFEVGQLGSDSMRAQAHQMPTMQQYTKLWKGGLPHTAGWLERHGWRTQFDDRGTVSAGYGRATAEPASGGFITATFT